MTFADRLFERAADVDGVVFDFGGVISVSPVKDWPIYPYCAAKGVDRAAMDAGWKKHRQKYSGWTAQIIQHECDHLAGIII